MSELTAPAEPAAEQWGTTQRYYRLYATPDGHSHWAELESSLQPLSCAPPAPPLLLSACQPATQWSFVGVPVGWHGELHPTPVRQLAIILAGEFEGATSEGQRWRLCAGDVLLMEDTTGFGHEA
jgi:hypothetical protein